MKTIQRNQTEVWYALPTGEEEIRDAQGYRTGERNIIYSEPVQTWMVLSPNRGSALREPFGIETNYNRIATTGDMDCPIKEDSILWVGIKPVTEENGVAVKHPHNFKVMRVAPSINYIVYALAEVDVSEVTDEP